MFAPTVERGGVLPQIAGPPEQGMKSSPVSGVYGHAQRQKRGADGGLALVELSLHLGEDRPKGVGGAPMRSLAGCGQA